MTPFIDRLARAKARPRLIENAVRIGFHDAIAWRIGGGGAPNAHAFTAATVAAARQALDAAEAESTERSRTLSSVQEAANRFITSALGRRLMTVPASQFVRLAAVANGPDAIIRDRRRRLHIIVLRFKADPLDAGRIASEAARATPLSAADRLTPLIVHVFALTSARRYVFEREFANTPRMRVA